MANQKISALTAAITIDATNDYLPIAQSGTSKKINRNTFLGITGSPLGTSDSQTVTNKTIGNTNTVTLKDTLFTLQDDSDVTKQAQFQLSGITTGTTRTYTLPNASSTLADIATAQTFTNKTLTAPTINNGSITGTTITTDAIVGQSVSNTGTVYGVSITTGTIGSAAIATGAITSTKISGIDKSLTTTDSNPYKFGVYMAGAFNWTASETILKFDTEEFDTNSNYTSATGLYTAPVAGFYIFSWNVFAATAGTTYYANLYKNGASLKRGVDIGVSGSPFLSRGSGGGTSLVQVAANDTFGVFIFSDSTHTGFPGQQFCYFNGILQCRT